MSKIKDLLARAISLASEQPMSYNEVESLLEDIDTCKVKIWLEEGAILPKYAHNEDACMDLFVKNIELNGGRIIYHTGVHVAYLRIMRWKSVHVVALQKLSQLSKTLRVPWTRDTEGRSW